MITPRRAFALSILFLLLTVSSVSVFAQSDRQTVVNIPFDFIVGDRSMAAGKYVIERNKRDSDTVWTITSKDTGASRKVFLTVPMRSNETQQETKLVFHRYENYNFLTAFWTAGGNTGRELQQSDRERNLGEKLPRSAKRSFSPDAENKIPLVPLTGSRASDVYLSGALFFVMHTV